MPNDETAILPLDQVIGPKFLLRVINKRSVEYTEMLESIGKNGLWNTVSVRPAGERAPGKFEIVDGNFRYECHLDLGLPTIAVLIKYNVSDEDVLAAQIQANALRQETTKTEYARQLRRIQESVPGITLAELAQLVKKNPIWVSHQLDLLKLSKNQRHLVDTNEMPAQSAYMLAKVPSHLRTNALAHQACVLPVKQFKALAAAIIKQFMEQVRDGKLAKNFNDLPFEPVPFYRGNVEVLAEIDGRNIAAEQVVIANAKTPVEGFIAGLKWSLHMDPQSIEEQRQAAQVKPDRKLRKLYDERKTNDPLDH